jgi:GYF domain 2
MLYHLTRGGQNYGPYTIEDLRRYVASGNVLLSDLAKSDEMTAWAPVSQVLGTQPAPAGGFAPPAPGYGAPGYPAQNYPAGSYAAYPDAPNLSWGLVLLFAFFTCTLFMFVWNLVLAAWMKRVQPNSTAIFYYSVATALLFLQIVFTPHVQMHTTGPGYHGWMWSYYGAHPLRNLLGVGVWIVRIIARFTMRSSLEAHFNGPEPVGLSLSGVMTFFFGGLYFQYHLNRINELKRMARFRGAAI